MTGYEVLSKRTNLSPTATKADVFNYLYSAPGACPSNFGLKDFCAQGVRCNECCRKALELDYPEEV